MKTDHIFLHAATVDSLCTSCVTHPHASNVGTGTIQPTHTQLISPYIASTAKKNMLLTMSTATEGGAFWDSTLSQMHKRAPRNSAETQEKRWPLSPSSQALKKRLQLTK